MADRRRHWIARITVTAILGSMMAIGLAPGARAANTGTEFLLSNSLTSGVADIDVHYGDPGDVPIAGDWNHDGTDTVGIYRNASFFLSNSNSGGFADVVLRYGDPGDTPLAGDWNGDGTDTVGVYRNATFMLTNSSTSGFADLVLRYGDPGDIPVVGDWNGDGVDTIGIFRGGTFMLSNSNTSGFADTVIRYGDPGDIPVVGDWNHDGTDTVGVYRNGVFLLSNSNTSGFADITLPYGNPGDTPLVGDWNGDGTETVGVLRNPPPPSPPPAAAPARPANRPDPNLTPGAIFPDITGSQVCVPGYSSSVRDVPQSEKNQVYAEYGITSHAPGEYEVDHLISLELGGSNDITNLWPEPYSGPDNAHNKDTVENRLHSEVCSGVMSLVDAQAAILHWWDYE